VALDYAAVELGGRVVWSDLSFAVRPGELVAVLGPNGAGKSTLLKVLLGLLPLAEGTLTLFGETVGAGRGNSHWRALRGRIGYLPQRRAFDRQARIRGVDLVRLGIDGSSLGLPWPAPRWLRFGPFEQERRRRARVAELLALVGAERCARRPVGECSGGEQQRLLVAQALARDPQLLLLDEPLNGLDLNSQAAVSGLVAELCRGRGLAALLVSLVFMALLPHVDRVLYLAGGRGAAGEVEEVITPAVLSSLYGTQIDVLRAADGRLVVFGGPEAPAHHPEHVA